MDWVNKEGWQPPFVFRSKGLEQCYQTGKFPDPLIWRCGFMPGGKKYFAVLDQRDSYWQLPLSEESSYWRTFNNPFGWYRFLCMPLGICYVSEVLQRTIYKVYGDMQGVEVIADNIIVAGVLRRSMIPCWKKCDARGKKAKCEVQSKKI